MRPLAVILFILSSIQCLSQQTPVFTQYYFNELIINPAYAGSHVQFSATTMYRNQWVNFPGAPKTFLISAHSSFMRDKIGLGMMVNADNIGSYSNKNVYFSYAYFLKWPKSSLSLGLSAGFDFISSDYSNLVLYNNGYNSGSPATNSVDPSFVSVNQFKPNVGTGFYYRRRNFFAGFSVPFLINNKLDYGSLEAVAGQLKQARYYFLRTGGVFPITPSRSVQLNPSITLRAQEGQALSMDINLGAIFYEICSAGVSYRTADSFISFCEFKLSEKIHVAYSYDWTTSKINLFSNGTHELMINYRTRIRRVHKNLECPSYYGYYPNKGHR